MMSCEGGAADGRGGRTEEEKWRDPSEKQEPHTVMWGNMSSSVGMMKIPIYGKIKAMFQTTNQYWKSRSKKSPRICQFWWKKSTFACGSRVYRWGSSGSTWPQDTWKIVPLRNWLITPFRLSHLLADKPSCSAPPNINGKFETSHEYVHEKPYPPGSHAIGFPISLVGS